MSIKYKLFCIDLDGTLLTKFKKISKKNMQYLLKYTCSGGNILINTGRNIVSANSIIEKLKKENIIINFVSALRGAYIVDKINNKIFKSKISDKISHEILDYCTKNKLVI
jgi:hydroxymethylpyrimidine pyrophosphatase-like HAD family hydrolase